MLLWLYISSLFKSTLWVEVPISFYNQSEETTIHAPEMVSLQLAGYYAQLRQLDNQQLAIHIDAQTLHDGKNPLIIHRENLFLPDSISVVNYSPLVSYIECMRSSNDCDNACV
jgi:hypothetical protein